MSRHLHPVACRATACVAGAVVALAAPGAVQPQAPPGPQPRSHATGPFASLGLIGNSLLLADDAGEWDPEAIDAGAGFDVQVGWGLSRHLTLYAAASRATLRSGDGGGPNVRLGQQDLGLRAHFRAGPERFVPYLNAALTRRSLSWDVGADARGAAVEAEANGSAVTIGFGGQIYLQPRVAVDLGLGWTIGRFDDWQVGGHRVADESRSALGGRFRLALAVWPTPR